jgi:RHS repeat-associated protein
MAEKTRAEQDSTNEADSKFHVEAPELTLPKGGGAIRGIGEKFGVNPVNGTGSMTVPVYASPGRSGFGPQLSLTYDSGNGNGPFGFGWSLVVNAITRKTDKGLPQYADAEESDVFLLAGAEDLMPALMETKGKWTRDIVPARTVYGKQYDIHRYRPRVEGSFARIERWINTEDPQDTYWRTISKDNSIAWYGKTPESRIYDPADPSRIFSWLICESYDDKGNVISYQYKPEDSTGIDLTTAHERNRSDKTRSAKRYLKHVFYGNRTPYFPDLTQSTPVALPTDWCFQLVFDFGEHDLTKPTPQDAGQWTCRLDPFSQYQPTFEVRTYRLCSRILMFHHFAQEPNVDLNCLVRSTDLTYAQPSTDPTKPFYSYLLSATQRGYRRDGKGGYLSNSLPPLEFEYTEAVVDETAREVDRLSLENLPYGLDGSKYRWVDLDGEGLPGILTEQGTSWFYKANLSPIPQQQIGGSEVTLARFAAVEVVARQPSLAALSRGSQQLLDLSGDGQLDLVDFQSATPGFFERTPHASWEPFKTFESLPALDWHNPNLRFIDLTGDGLLDLLVSEDDIFCWHASLGVEGFDRERRVPQALHEEKGPKVIFSDGTETMFLADMSGDGLTDLVRIRNGEVCYWPNLGYGRFGAKVAMDQSPRFDRPELFDARSIRLADIDGTGTADIIYFSAQGVDLYFNASGNAYAERYTLDHFPPVESISLAAALDLLGNGTACLVWSSPLAGNARRQMRYIDLMGGQKPHLLMRVRNNLGAETVVRYAPSTKFYVADKVASTPWVTRLPFPVHVVERVETYDRISRNHFVTRYSYHHGYFDGVEREFRGFGMVEQWDTEEFAALTESGILPEATNIDPASHVPPVLTRTWFHTGAYLDRESISRQFEGEYYHEPGLNDQKFRALLLPDTILPTGLTLEEEREACRALKGSMLRKEVYAHDAPPGSSNAMIQRARTPYIVVEQNFTIRTLQPRAGNRHAVFFTHPSEAITYHYERRLVSILNGQIVVEIVAASNPNTQWLPDPRIQHALTLEVDIYGNVLKEAAIGYGRRFDAPDVALVPQDRERQRLIHITYTENTFTKPIVDKADDHRTPLPSETRTYELRKPEQEKSSNGQINRYRFDDLLGYVKQSGDGNHDVDYEDIQFAKAKQAAVNDANEGKKYFRRLIEHVRTLYRTDDLTALLPLGELEPLALPGESYKLVFTPGLLAQVFQRNGQPLLTNPTNVLSGQGTDRGGYVDLDGNGHWWIPSGRVFLSPNSNDTAAPELAYARQHFFLPHRYRNPFHTNTVNTETLVSYDAHDLLVEETRDALGNRVTVGERNVDPTQPLVRHGHDYRVLQPALMMDPNRNRSVVAFDALGMVVGTAVMGKPEDNPVPGDRMATTFHTDLTQAEIDQFFANPKGPIIATLLDNATTRIIYDLTCYWREPDPQKKQPVFAATLARETHTSDPVPASGLKIQASFSYSDGFGREIQKKIQAEPGPVPKRDANGKIIVSADGQPEMTANDVSPRLVGSGWTVFNNKGKPVRQYEPFFTDTHRFEFDVKIGVSPVLFYDPVERVVATLQPHHIWEKVIFDPWGQETWDVNDTVLISDPKTDADVGAFFSRLPDSDYLPTWHALRTDPLHLAEFAARYPDAMDRSNETSAAAKCATHAETPTTRYFDTLGRTFLTIAHNRFKHNSTVIGEKYPTRVELDIEGNQRAVRDAIVQNGDTLGRIVMRYDYDMLSNRIHQASMEAGERWMLNDVMGKPIRAWDSRKFMRRMTYDVLRRPIGLFVTENGVERLAERTVYGENQGDTNNHRTRVYQIFDGAGVVTNENYDFKGNLMRSKRELLPDYQQDVDWLQNPIANDGTFTTRTEYDALNRPLAITSPDGSVYRPTFNEANMLNTVEVNLRGAGTTTSFVTNIDYNAKGQRMSIRYANEAETTYEYDDQTYRLIHLKTTRPAGPNGLASQFFTDTTIVQDLHYTYDPVGNITHIADDAIQTIQYNNENVEPEADYIYDAIYRLISSLGREHIGQTAFDFKPPNNIYRDYPFFGLHVHPNDPKAVRNYTETYKYDEVGNIKSIRHSAQNGSWTRSYTYHESSLLESGKKNNRLTSTQLGNGFNFTETYGYTDAQGNDVHGCMTSINSMQMVWDFKDQLQTVNLGSGGKAYYVYDASGQRVRKVINSQNGTKQKERIYLGSFEIYREYNGSGGTTPKLVRETLHIMDDKQRIALVETRTQGSDNSPQQLTRYQFGNHLGSAVLELDYEAKVISYEEYTPYGSTSYQALGGQTETPKRYRYTGKERDEESGLYYYGARYYAAWLGRWVSCDTTLDDTPNLYTYTKINPVKFMDPDGRRPATKDEAVELQRLQQVESGARERYSKLSTARKVWSQLVGGPQIEAGRAKYNREAYAASINRAAEKESIVIMPGPVRGVNVYMTEREVGMAHQLEILQALTNSALASATYTTADIAGARPEVKEGLTLAASTLSDLAFVAVQTKTHRDVNSGWGNYQFGPQAEMMRGDPLEPMRASPGSGSLDVDPKDRILFHYTDLPESSFSKGFWRDASATDNPNLTPEQAVKTLGLRQSSPPDKIIPIRDRGHFVPNSPFIVQPVPSKGITGGGTDYRSIRKVPPVDILPATPINKKKE